MIWLFQHVWLWVVISAIFGFAVTLATVLERRPVVELGVAASTGAAARAGRHSARAHAAATAAAELAAVDRASRGDEAGSAAHSEELADVTIEPFDPATD